MPKARVARLLGVFWAAPLTAAGLLQAALGGARLVGARRGALHFADAGRGLVGFFFRHTGVTAYTWGQVITYRTAAGADDERLLRHELRHVEQAMRWGALLPLAYCLASLLALLGGRGWYTDNAFERAARAAEDDRAGVRR